MQRVLTALVSGLLFGAGLIVSGMADPAKVQNFLDIAGTWDPSLIFVMGGALVVTFVGFRLALRRGAPLCAPRFELPTRRDLDGRLIGGAALFGLGWGLVGYCPGPALAGILIGGSATWIFVAAMIAGFLGTRLLLSGMAAAPGAGQPSAR